MTSATMKLTNTAGKQLEKTTIKAVCKCENVLGPLA